MSKTNKDWHYEEEHAKLVPEWNKKWIDIIRSTEPIDFDKTVEACRGMLRAADLPENPRFVRVPSPMVGAVVAGCAAVFWKHHKSDVATRVATDVATRDATVVATDEATRVATFDATSAATDEATRVATFDATSAATFDATNAATRDATFDATSAATRVATFDATDIATSVATFDATDFATRDATDEATDFATSVAIRAATDEATSAATSAATSVAIRAATSAATSVATDFATSVAIRAATFDATFDAPSDVNMKELFEIALGVVAGKLKVHPDSILQECVPAVAGWYTFYNGGSEWAAWMSYLSFVRDVIGWSHPVYENYAHYENAAIHGGPRFMHRDFILLSDRAKERHIDEAGRPHNESGPAVSWHCGHKVWFIHGVAVDEQIVMRPETQTIEQIDRERNSDVRAIRIARFGWLRYLKESGAVVRDSRHCDITNTKEALCSTSRGEQRLVVTCPTRRQFAIGVPDSVNTCEEAQQWLAGDMSRFKLLART